ncbi:predicted protein [Phaeodactylum tricornutum CCAP 1055/1]|uniref:Autophagy-related protein n=1 Tax=Phaeodactylum tricornutum (strain CCAP 1055/1) TaxID=556484 RepID=B7FSE4_PHATC|nr:predicted protein [Phaeodactylum tricornutum CCAP 1055/1]EEC50464.1 predicted protein [Phaeodactylum tricornutum CCAP 1055/1]|eukprot:XP_002177650.1 predicted protein [Phaeodactylum tricornutum CCAP 1055/1]
MSTASDDAAEKAAGSNVEDGSLSLASHHFGNETEMPKIEEGQLRRAQSISEAVENNDDKLCNAPWFLKFIEYPFHVKDPTRDVYLPEAAGWAMDSAGRGPLNQVGSYVGQAILRLATQDAGCLNPRTCTNTVYGLKPSSLLTATTSIVGVVAAFLMPIVGAVVDHTTHRRLLGLVSGMAAVVLAGIQISVNANNWFFILCVDGALSFSLLVHTTAVFAYLPDLSLDENVLSHYTSHFNIRQYSVQVVYLGLVIITGEVRNLPSQAIATSVQTAKDAAGISFGVAALFIGYAWIFLFRPRPALSKVPEGQTLLTTGFVQVHRTGKKIWKDYWALKWFMFSLLWSPEAGAGVIQSIAVTFLTVVMKFTGLDLAKAMLVLMVGNICGSLFSKWVCQKINPLNSYRCGLMSLAVSIFVSAWTLNGPERRAAVFGFTFFWGVSMGWVNPSQRVLLCTLIPKGQETEMMGLFVFTGQILGWLPPLIFTLMNENGADIRWGFGLVTFFCGFAAICTLPMGNYYEAVAWAARQSEEKLGEVLVNAQSRSEKLHESAQSIGSQDCATEKIEK